MEYKFDFERHLHSLDGKPLIGTSTVINVLSKPLTWWASGLAVGELGWRKPIDWRTAKGGAWELDALDRAKHAEPYLETIKTLTPEEYVTLLDKAYKAHSVKLKDSAKEGTDLHAEAEDWVKSMMRGTGIMPHEKILPFVNWAKVNVKRFLWSEAHCYSRELWVGGVSDCGAELNDGAYCIIDFKSSKEAYPSQAFQIAGYDIQITENGLFSSDGKHTKKIDKPFTKHIVIPFGAKECVPVVFTDVEGNREAFKACLLLHKKLNVTD